MYFKFTHYLFLAVISVATVSAISEPELDPVARANPTRTLAAPAASGSGCNPLDCRAECGPGCGGECVKNASSGRVVRVVPAA